MIMINVVFFMVLIISVMVLIFLLIQLFSYLKMKFFKHLIRIIDSRIEEKVSVSVRRSGVAKINRRLTREELGRLLDNIIKDVVK